MAGNDLWANATDLSGSSSGSGSDDLYGATIETGEPDLAVLPDPNIGTLWYVFTPTNPGTLTFTLSTALAIDIDAWSGGDLNSLIQQDFDVSGQVQLAVAAGVPIYIRVYATAPVLGPAPYSYSWAYTQQDNTLTVTLLSDCPAAPGHVNVNVGNLALGSTVNFYIDNSSTAALTDVVPDEDGVGITVGTVYYVPLEEQFLFVSVPVPAVDAGTHTLKITSSTGYQAIVSFNVLVGTAGALTTSSDGLIGTDATNRWWFRDPAPGGETYIFETNPLTMGSPYPERAITAGHTTAPDGQPMEWEGVAKAVSWTIGGTLFTQAQLEAFQRFAALDHRIWIVDHLDRGWLVTVEQLDAEPRTKGTAQYPWLHDWKMTLLVFGGPVTPS